MKVLLTGATGHIGGAILAALLHQGHEVTALCRRSPHTDAAGLHIVSADLINPALLERTLATLPPHDALVHAAAMLDQPSDPAEMVAVNCDSTEHLFSWHARNSGGPLIYLSSIGIIGTPPQCAILESSPYEPPTLYHRTKLWGEGLVGIYREQTSLSACSLRLSSPVGAGMQRARLFSIFANRAIRQEPLLISGAGTRRQNFVDGRDVASAVMVALSAGELHSVYNIAGAHSVSSLELAEACIETYQSSSAIEWTGLPDPEDKVDWDISTALAQSHLGWEPQYTIEDSLRDYRNWIGMQTG